MSNISNEIKEYKELLDSKAITNEEYAELKKKALHRVFPKETPTSSVHTNKKTSTFLVITVIIVLIVFCLLSYLIYPLQRNSRNTHRRKFLSELSNIQGHINNTSDINTNISIIAPNFNFVNISSVNPSCDSFKDKEELYSDTVTICYEQTTRRIGVLLEDAYGGYILRPATDKDIDKLMNQN